ncbi:glutamine synthetase family protein [Nguyenibacter vanlangensis]|uniref:Glutamine synthetase family protein n=1 Tax=Nguyenibacter vanlangensis TaxID=1216886 RepID=A0ABZ3D906_9PROT
MSETPQAPWQSVDPTGLFALLTNDLVGITRGRFFPLPLRERAVLKGCGWVPANLGLTPFDEIAADNPWGCVGDLRLRPDPDTAYRTTRLGEGAFAGMLCDITTLDHQPWYGCGRSFLRAALKDLETEFGLSLFCAFESEFQVTGATWAHAPAFSLQAMRRADDFMRLLVDALADVGVDPEIILPEYGQDQYEVPCAPRDALQAADKAVLFREVTREAARLSGLRATFTPKMTPQGVGNGMHIHFSLKDRNGRFVTFDPQHPAGVSERCGAFVAGIMRHMPALMAFCAPTAISYMRLQAHHWSSAYASFGLHNREAALRICPVAATDPATTARLFNIEFRPPDGTASPYWALGALVRAGIEGLRHGLPTPDLCPGDPDSMDEATRRQMGIRRLPGSLREALDAFMADSIVRGWLDSALVEGIRSAKQCEIDKIQDWTDDESCRRYATIF